MSRILWFTSLSICHVQFAFALTSIGNALYVSVWIPPQLVPPVLESKTNKTALVNLSQWDFIEKQVSHDQLLVLVLVVLKAHLDQQLQYFIAHIIMCPVLDNITAAAASYIQ